MACKSDSNTHGHRQDLEEAPAILLEIFPLVGNIPLQKRHAKTRTLGGTSASQIFFQIHPSLLEEEALLQPTFLHLTTLAYPHKINHYSQLL